ncbi:flagellar biosynthesis protein FlhF [Methylomarinovum caldicuralii]|uniref:Flagellar biosynthesis protein FlhF n=1 Tax=Methylomarinovum caldicuralii TaxID=438856 RepID=A0AAU9CF06_9GAMM|nr:flagellar biosynthesis protein FlhF [Methylomarinovum caldicuralii]BCX81590.1 flagellar biosynthesis protein FlhF [Methylomarinovum caldicuralii]
MKIKRFLAPDIRQALQQVKEQLGPDAVILSNRKTDDGVEIVAARDFDVEIVDSVSKAPKPEAVSKTKPASKVRAGKVTPKPAFSAKGYSAVAEMGKRAGATPKSKASARDTKPVADRTRPAPKSKARIYKPEFPKVQSAESSQPGSLQDEPRQHPAGTQQEDALAVVRQELKQMRRLLDRHLPRDARQESLRDHPVPLALFRLLNEQGFSRSLAMSLAQQAGAEAEVEDALALVRRLLAERLPVMDDPLLDYGGIVALVGPTGVGKTTTIAKLAARFRLKHGPRQIALVTTDNYRIAAHEQLSTYARILGVPVRVAGNPDELQAIVRSFMDKKLVLIDTAGMSQRDLRLAEQFALLRDSRVAIETYLVLSAASQLPSLYEALDAFAGFQPKACILTKLDEAGVMGPVLSSLVERGLPAAFVTDGQQVPEDLHPARSDDLIARAFATLTADEHPPADVDFAFEGWVNHASV